MLRQTHFRCPFPVLYLTVVGSKAQEKSYKLLALWYAWHGLIPSFSIEKIIAI